MQRLLLALSLFCFVACLAVSDREELYQKGVLLRNKEGPTPEELRSAAQALLEASGLILTRSSQLGLSAPTGKSSRSPREDTSAEALQGFPTVLVPTDTHNGAVRELAKAFQEGRGVDLNLHLSAELFRLAATRGDPEAQGRMAVLHTFGLHHPGAFDATGIQQFGQVDEAGAILNYYFAAQGGDTLSRMALGYRHLYGLGVPKSCWAAAKYLQLVAEEALEAAGRPSSLPHIEVIRLNVQASQGLKADRHKELLQFHQLSADRGDVKAQTNVGRVLNYGTHGITRDHSQALRYFQKAADGNDANAMAHLGHMHAAGYGTPKDLDQAVKWFERAAQLKQPSALFALGYIHLTGTGAEKDYSLAMNYFLRAAELGNSEAHFYLGVMYMKGFGVKQRSANKAFAYFSLAAQSNHMLGMYNAAMMYFAGRGTVKKCRTGVLLLKQIAERGPAAAVIQRGHEQFFRGHYSVALLNYLAASELGMEPAQSNAAWMLQQGYGNPEELAAAVAVSLHKRAAEQGNVPALLALGDAHFYGKGAPQDWVRAAAIYYEAYEQRSAEACFNLGFMHEFAAGVPKDLYLAKELYAMARKKQPDAVVPIHLATTWLALHEKWDALRPHLPPRLDFIWDRIFVLQPPCTSPLGSIAELMGSLPPLQLGLHGELLRQRLAALPGVPLLMKQWEGLKDTSDTMLLAALVATLFTVLHLRRRRQAITAQPPDLNAPQGARAPEPPAAHTPGPSSHTTPSPSAPTTASSSSPDPPPQDPPPQDPPPGSSAQQNGEPSASAPPP